MERPNTSAARINESKSIIQKNKRGIQPEISAPAEEKNNEIKIEGPGEERIDRFDNNNRKRNKKRKNYRKRKIHQR